MTEKTRWKWIVKTVTLLVLTICLFTAVRCAAGTCHLRQGTQPEKVNYYEPEHSSRQPADVKADRG